jgi:hypothetical protein
MNKLKIISFISAVSIAVVGLLFQMSSIRAAETALVVISLNAPAKATVGTQVLVPINISEVTDLNAANYRITFNSALLRLDSVTDGKIGSTPLPVDGYKVVQPGICNVINYMKGIDGATGSGTMATMRFHALASGNVEIKFTQGVLSNVSAMEIEAEWVGDTMTIKPAQRNSGGGSVVVVNPSPTPTPTPAELAPTPTVEPVVTPTPELPIATPVVTVTTTPDPNPSIEPTAPKGQIAGMGDLTPLPDSTTPAESPAPGGSNNWTWLYIVTPIVIIALCAGVILLRKRNTER